MMENKKVVVILTEGITDIDLLKPYLDQIVDKTKIRFEITDGDLLTKHEFNQKNAKSIVGSFISRICEKRKFRDEDILFVAHILDLDGSYIDSDNIIVDENLNCRKKYDLENNLILIKDVKHKGTLEKTWKKKKNRQKVLYSTSKIKNIDYIILYNSINIEHVISGEVLYDPDEKEACIDNFVQSFDLQEFMDFFASENILISKEYIKSWEKIEKDTDGFKRASNLIFLINKLISL